MPDVLSRAAIEQIEARKSDGEVRVVLTRTELNALCALAKRGLERPTCATCRYAQDIGICLACNNEQVGRMFSRGFYPLRLFGCTLHEPKPSEVIP